MTRSATMSNGARYEVILVPSETSLTASEWTWRRFESDSDISAQGSRHVALRGCFAEVREHASRFGPAAVAVNLRGDDAATAPLTGAVVPNREATRPNRLAPKALLRRRSALRG